MNVDLIMKYYLAMNVAYSFFSLEFLDKKLFWDMIIFCLIPTFYTFFDYTITFMNSQFHSTRTQIQNKFTQKPVSNVRLKDFWCTNPIINRFGYLKTINQMLNKKEKG